MLRTVKLTTKAIALGNLEGKFDVQVFSEAHLVKEIKKIEARGNKVIGYVYC